MIVQLAALQKTNFFHFLRRLGKRQKVTAFVALTFDLLNFADRRSSLICRKVIVLTEAYYV